MRLSAHARQVIQRATAELAGPGARVRLFGSRVRPERRGGDIDLLVELPTACADRLRLGLRIGTCIERQLGMQRIDVLVADPGTPDSPVLRIARLEGIDL